MGAIGAMPELVISAIVMLVVLAVVSLIVLVWLVRIAIFGFEKNRLVGCLAITLFSLILFGLVIWL